MTDQPGGQPALATPRTLGKQVHYVSYGTRDGEYPSVCRVAWVTETGGWLRELVAEQADGTRIIHETHSPTACTLLVANPTGLFLNGPIRHDARGTGGTWHMPRECPHYA